MSHVAAEGSLPCPAGRGSAGGGPAPGPVAPPRTRLGFLAEWQPGSRRPSQEPGGGCEVSHRLACYLIRPSRCVAQTQTPGSQEGAPQLVHRAPAVPSQHGCSASPLHVPEGLLQDSRNNRCPFTGGKITGHFSCLNRTECQEWLPAGTELGPGERQSRGLVHTTARTPPPEATETAPGST